MDGKREIEFVVRGGGTFAALLRGRGVPLARLVAAVLALWGVYVLGLRAALGCPLRNCSGTCGCCGGDLPVQITSESLHCEDPVSESDVRYKDGVLGYKAPGISFSGAEGTFGLRLGFNNNPEGVENTDHGLGYNWWLEGAPFLERKVDGTLIVIWGATSAARFRPEGNIWKGEGRVLAQIRQSSDGGENVLVLDGLSGGKIIFHRWNCPEAWKKGRVKRIEHPGGHRVDFQYREDYGIDAIQEEGAAREWHFYYNEGGGELHGTVQAIVVVYTGDWSVLVKMLLDYYRSGDQHGYPRDLKTLEIQERTSDQGVFTSKKCYFRYWKTGDARAHRARYILGPASYAEAAKAAPPEAMDDATLAGYADYVVDYYTAGQARKFVSSAQVRSGCDCGGGGARGTYVYRYALQAEDPEHLYTKWVTRVREARPDGSVDWVYVNRVGAVIDRVRSKTVGQNTYYWGTHNEYDDNTGGGLSWRAHPSACDASASGVVVKEHEGLVQAYEYDGAFSTVSKEWVKKGREASSEGVDMFLLRQYAYDAITPRPTVIETRVEAPGEAPRWSTVAYAYEYYDPNAKNLKLVTKTPPAVPASQNGHGTWQGRERTCYHPAYGKVLWTEVKVWGDPAEYRVRAYAYDSYARLVKEVADPSPGIWQAMKAGMGLGSEVPDPEFSSGTHVEAATDYEYDAAGRLSRRVGPEVWSFSGSVPELKRPDARWYYTKLSTGERVTLECAHVEGGQYKAPIVITVHDAEGRVVTVAHGDAGSSGDDGDLSNDISTTAGDSDQDGDVLDDAFVAGELFDRRSYQYAGGYLLREEVWREAEDGSPGNRYARTHEYENGLLKTTTDFDGTVRTTARSWESTWTRGYVETDSVGSPGVVVGRRYYDFGLGSLDRPGLAEATEWISDSESNARKTLYSYDWRGRLEVVVEPPDAEGKSVVRKTVYDQADRPVDVDRFYDADGNGRYDSGTADRRIGRSKTRYDDVGRVWESVEVEGDTAGGQTGDPKERRTRSTYDLAGGRIRAEGPTGLYEKAVYDGLGRVVGEYVSYDEPLEGQTESGYLEARSVADDIVVFERGLSYDRAGHVWIEEGLERHHDAEGEGGLDGSTNAISETTLRLRDALGRLIYEDFRGSGAGGDGIVRRYEYSPHRGVLEEVRQMVSGSVRATRFAYDDLRRKVSETRNHDPNTNGGEPSPGVHDRNQKVVFVYGAPSAPRPADRDPYRVLERWAYDTPRGGGEPEEVKIQKTRWVYGPPKGGGAGQSEIASGELLWKICYADPTTGEAHFDAGDPERAADAPYQVTFAYNRQGELQWKRTQAYIGAQGPEPGNATVFEYGYSEHTGRLESETAVSLRTGVDGAVRGVAWAYDRLGRLASVQTKRSDDSGETVLSEVAYEYGAFGEVRKTYQEHAGAKTGNSLRVDYAYSPDAVRRPQAIAYPDDAAAGRNTVFYRYSPANPAKWQLAADRLARVSGITIADSQGNPYSSNVLSYQHAGLDRVVGKSTDLAGSGATTWRLYDNRSPGQPYNGLDRWGRTKDIWMRGSGTLRSHLTYSYDELGSVTARMEELPNLYDETYAYDGLERLSGETVTRPSPSWTQTKTWALSLLGNWREAAVQGGTTDTRTHNRENEIATRTYGSNTVVPEYDVRGNTRLVPGDSSAANAPSAVVVYDAWDRPVEVRKKVEQGTGDLLAEYRYDGLGRVIWRRVRNPWNVLVSRDYYYGEAWQVLSERASAQAGSSYRKMDYVWGLGYVDELACRVDYSGGSPVRKDFVQDANWNVVMLLSNSGAVDERYRYDAYGDPVFLNANGDVKTSGILNSTYLFQGRRLIEWRAPSGGSTALVARTYHYRHREHLPVLGRFAQRDPLDTDVEDGISTSS